MKNRKFLSTTYLSLVMTFLYLPIVVLMIYSFNENKGRGVWTGFSTKWYTQLFSNELIIEAFINTMILAIISSVVATLIGTIASIGLDSMNKWLKSGIMGFTYIPIINPDIITGVSLMLVFVAFRTIGFNIEQGFTTILIAHITINIPYVILNVMPKLRQMDKSIYEAALDLGCPPVKAFMKVVIPEIAPGIVAGFLMAFTFSMDDFVVSHFTTGPSFQTLPIAIYSMTRRRVSPEMNALSTIIFVVVLLVLLASNIRDIKKEQHHAKLRAKGGGSY